MLQLLTGIPWVDNLRLATMNPVRRTKHLTVTVEGGERDGTWKEGLGIYVSGHDFEKGDTVLIEGEPQEAGVLLIFNHPRHLVGLRGRSLRLVRRMRGGTSSCR